MGLIVGNTWEIGDWLVRFLQALQLYIETTLWTGGKTGVDHQLSSVQVVVIQVKVEALQVQMQAFFTVDNQLVWASFRAWIRANGGTGRGGVVMGRSWSVGGCWERFSGGGGDFVGSGRNFGFRSGWLSRLLGSYWFGFLSGRRFGFKSGDWAEFWSGNWIGFRSGDWLGPRSCNWARFRSGDWFGFLSGRRLRFRGSYLFGFLSGDWFGFRSGNWIGLWSGDRARFRSGNWIGLMSGRRFRFRGNDRIGFRGGDRVGLRSSNWIRLRSNNRARFRSGNYFRLERGLFGSGALSGAWFESLPFSGCHRSSRNNRSFIWIIVSVMLKRSTASPQPMRSLSVGDQNDHQQQTGEK